MLVVGLTGGIGSGKSAACTLFEQQGIEIIDTDVIARQIVAPDAAAYCAIVARFGASNVVMPTDRTLNRRALREIVFADPQEKKWLEQLTHPMIRTEVERQVANAISAYVIVAVPLLVENGKYAFIDRVLVVDCAVALQIERACQRDNMSFELAETIIASQASRERRLAIADDVLDNNQDLAHLARQVYSLHQNYLTLASTNSP